MQNFALLLEGTKWGLTSNTSMPSKMTSDRSQTEMIMSAVSQTRPVLDRATRVEKDLDEEMPQESPETTNSSSSKEVVEQVTSEKSQIERTVSGLNQTSPVLDVLPVFGQDQQSDVTLDDIQVHRDFYRFPVPTTQLAKVSKLLSMQKGCLSGLQGKSLDEIALEGEIALSDAEAEDSQRESDDNGTTFTSHCGNIKPVDAASVSALAEEAHDTEGFGNDAAQQRDSRRITKRTWSKAEVAAVMRHFRDHISKGKLATKNECSHCKLVEDPVLAQRTVQNIRDFVRNRGTAAKRQPQKHKL
ncbi:uncharacterized protein LOC115404221 isoform X2 [Salarias fasciatus]|uniref:uncharacterized protein LOC115404221 isoform X2 n=1 Tax=Salarias fasciatus TaxID=181472 RepID=UPI001176FDE0|nr:uncharacterized protein LOC115404221 isoform X2 [Salarias fasciatus]